MVSVVSVDSLLSPPPGDGRNQGSPFPFPAIRRKDSLISPSAMTKGSSTSFPGACARNLPAESIPEKAKYTFSRRTERYRNCCRQQVEGTDFIRPWVGPTKCLACRWQPGTLLRQMPCPTLRGLQADLQKECGARLLSHVRS